MRLACLVLLAAFFPSCAARAPLGLLTREGVRFALDVPEARSVVVCGSFNNWSPTSHALARQSGTTSWTLVVSLPAGRHVFMYLVDGERWVTPPVADEEVPDGFGGMNGVVVVP